ncbi:MAG: hypothetical protein NZ561_09480, partial [Phycisphaerae bacterium]|nr:hypothetical protein [Phycisphaerae bacterium]
MAAGGITGPPTLFPGTGGHCSARNIGPLEVPRRINPTGTARLAMFRAEHRPMETGYVPRRTQAA